MSYEHELERHVQRGGGWRLAVDLREAGIVCADPLCGGALTLRDDAPSTEAGAYLYRCAECGRPRWVGV